MAIKDTNESIPWTRNDFIRHLKWRSFTCKCAAVFARIFQGERDMESS